MVIVGNTKVCSGLSFGLSSGNEDQLINRCKDKERTLGLKVWEHNIQFIIKPMTMKTYEFLVVEKRLIKVNQHGKIYYGVINGYINY